MALSFGQSGGGYPRTSLRVTDSFGPDRSGVDTQPTRGGGWFSNILDASRKIVDEGTRRQEEDKRRQEEEQRRRDEEEVQRMQARDADNERRAAERLADPVWSWAHSPEGRDFLSAGGAHKVDYNAFENEPDKFLATNPNMREYRWGFGGQDEGRIPSAVVERMAQYAQSEEGQPNFKAIGTKDYAGPVHTIVKDLTGSDLAAGVASSALFAVPGIGPALGGAEMGAAPGSDKMDRRLLADALGAVGTSLTMGRGVNVLESGAADAAAAKFGQNAATRLAAKAATRAGLNVVEDVPVSAVQMAAYGADPTSKDYWKALGVQAGMSGAAGAAVPVAGQGFKALANVPTELKGAAAAYITAKSFGADDDEAASYAAMAAAGVAVGRRGIPGAIKSGLGLGDILPHVNEMDAAGNPVRTPVLGAQTQKVGDAVTVYHGSNGPVEGDLRPGAFVTTDRNVAETFARAQTRLSGGSPVVSEFQAGLDAIAKPAENDLASSYGNAYVVKDPAGITRATGDRFDPQYVNEKTWYHGSGTQGLTPDKLDPAMTKVDNLFGMGVYLTDSRKIAEGYKRARGQASKTPIAYEAKVSVSKVLDLERPLAPDAFQAIRDGAVGIDKWTQGASDVAGTIDRAAQAPGATGQSVWRALSDEVSRVSHEERIPTYEFEENFALISEGLRKVGYDALTHTGGLRTGNAPHQVLILLDPNDIHSGTGRAGQVSSLTRAAPLDLVPTSRQLPTPPGAQPPLPGAAGGGALPPGPPPPPLLNGPPPEFGPPRGRERAYVPPPDDGIPFPKPGMGDDFLRQADEQLDSHKATTAYKAVVERVRGEWDTGTSSERARSLFADLLGLPVKLVEAIDPATKYARPVLRSVLAASNFINSQAIELVGRQKEIMADLRPLIGESRMRGLEREAVRLAPLAAAAGISVPFGDVRDKNGRQAIAFGLMASYALHTDTALGRAGIKSKLPFSSVQYTKALNNGNLPGAGIDARDLPAGLKSGQGKLAHIILHPEDFSLTPAQLRAAKAGQNTLGAAFAGMQEFQKWAGRPMTTDTLSQENRLFQWFTRDSVEKVLGKDYFAPKSGRPGFAADLPVEQQRLLGTDIVDAMVKHPGLRLEGDVVGLMMRDLDQKARVASNAIIVKGLTSGTEGADGFVRDRTSALGDKAREAIAARDALPDGDPRLVEADSNIGNTMRELRAAEKAEAALGVDKSWGEIPGIEGHKFAPEILKAVQNLAVERNGEFGGLLDKVTSNIRTLMFTADLSAWTMQGWMLAMRDPRGAVKAMPHVLAASILGDRYTAEWIKDNYMLSRKWAARGVVNGTMVDEHAFGTAVGRMPIVHGIERRGFSNALPVFRILMAEHMSRMETMASLVTEGNTLSKVAGHLGLNDFTRLAQVGAAYGPMAAGVGVAAGTGGEIDPKDWQDWFALALGAGGTIAMSKVLDGAAKSAYERATPTQRALAETRVAKDINRVSGIMNKPQLGISQKQAQIERTFLFRSPALLRNTLIMAKLALTNTGPEGAMARVYLLQTGVMLAGASALTKFALTGEMDSFNPDDPDSVLNPAHFAQAGLGATGKASASNPLASLARAVFYHQGAEGEPGRGLQMPGVRDVSLGLMQYGENRLTDVVGQLYKPGVDLLREGISGQKVENESPLAAGIQALGERDMRGVGAAVGRMAVPISVQEAAQAGGLDAMGIAGDPDYNNTKERLFGPLATMAGFNTSPETRSQESKRRTDAAIREEFPGATDFNKSGTIDRRDLNDADRQAFDASPAGQELAAFREETQKLRPQDEVSQVDLYFTARDKALDEHVQKLRSIERAVANKTMSRFEYRTAYQAEQARYLHAKDQIESDWSDQLVERPVWNPDTGKAEQMSVVAYVNRGDHPEDKNVDEWFGLFDKATGPSGRLDFDKLDSLQGRFKSGLAPDEQRYLDQRLASFKDRGITDSAGNAVKLPALKEYEGVKAKAKPFWDIADQQFAVLQQRDPFFQQFKGYNDYKRALLDAAGGDTIIATAIEDGLKKRSPWLKRFAKDVERSQRTMRAQSPDLDSALADWYQRAPVNPLGYIARKAGDTQYDAQGMSFASGRRQVSQGQKLKLAQQYGLTSPSFSDTFGYR